MWSLYGWHRFPTTSTACFARGIRSYPPAHPESAQRAAGVDHQRDRWSRSGHDWRWRGVMKHLALLEEAGLVSDIAGRTPAPALPRGCGAAATQRLAGEAQA
jgi:hypothetical protein